MAGLDQPVQALFDDPKNGSSPAKSARSAMAAFMPPRLLPVDDRQVGPDHRCVGSERVSSRQSTRSPPTVGTGSSPSGLDFGIDEVRSLLGSHDLAARHLGPVDRQADLVNIGDASSALAREVTALTVAPNRIGGRVRKNDDHLDALSALVDDPAPPLRPRCRRRRGRRGPGHPFASFLVPAGTPTSPVATSSSARTWPVTNSRSPWARTHERGSSTRGGTVYVTRLSRRRRPRSGSSDRRPRTPDRGADVEDGGLGAREVGAAFAQAVVSSPSTSGIFTFSRCSSIESTLSATSTRYRPTWPSGGTASGSGAAPASQIG